ncbi:XRE family transcriptional regulator [Butyricicoccus sp. 1XD8-22]|nr:XRE family transcriptional regulator [Butyricicoccus sp. 1XD8-22]
MTEYLPGTTGERITELREGAGSTIEELALKVGVNATTLGRMEKGQTQKIGDDVLTALAREFNVSTDFLLGLTSIPDRKNYDIAELGLSTQAARNLYTRKVNADVVNRLLEHPRFATLTAMIEHYLDDTFAAGAAVQNQILNSMSEILLGIGQNDPVQSEAAGDAARAVSLAKVPVHQTELTKIQNTFMAIVREMKQDAGSNLDRPKRVTKEVLGKLMAELTKGQDALSPSVTPEQITDAIIHTVDGSELDPEKLAEFRDGLASLFENLPRPNETHDQ